jgi:hypothetical protein
MSMPLYLKIQNKVFEDLQILDLETLEWIRSRQNPKIFSISENKADFKPLNEEEIKEVIPKLEWFSNSNRALSIHGRSHAVRTTLFSYAICKLNNISSYKKHLVAASIHDISRGVDNDDFDHGERSANWFKENHSLFRGLTQKEKEEIYFAVYYHDIEQENIPIEILDKNREIINVLKCADALDRFRLPKEKWWPNRNFFKIDIPDWVFEMAKWLVYQSELDIIKYSKDPVDAVLSLGFKAGLNKFINKSSIPI